MKSTYTTPLIELLAIAVEQGFAASIATEIEAPTWNNEIPLGQQQF